MKIRLNLIKIAMFAVISLLLIVSIVFIINTNNSNAIIKETNMQINNLEDVNDELNNGLDDLLKIGEGLDTSETLSLTTRIIDVVLINASDKIVFSNSLANDFNKRFNDNVDDDFLSVHEYYYTMSRGSVDLWANIRVCQTDKNLEYYSTKNSSNALSEMVLWEEARHFGNQDLVSNDYGVDIDAKCIILPCERGAVGDLSWPHAYFMGLMCLPYNKADVPTLVHESLHMLGLYDLYTSGTREVVSTYDIMCDTYNGNASLSAYYRNKLGWISKGNYGSGNDAIKVLSDDGTYTLNINTSQTGIIAYEFGKRKADLFYVEYRKNSNTFDNGVYGSGLLVYRINTAAQGNLNYDSSGLYSMYVFSSTGGTVTRYNGYVKSGKSIGFINETSSLALTYSDGERSSFVINNIVENPNGTITFSITSNDSAYQGEMLYSLDEFKSFAIAKIVSAMSAISEIFINPISVGKKIVIEFVATDGLINNKINKAVDIIVEKIKEVYEEYGGIDAIKNGIDYVINGITSSNIIEEITNSETVSKIKSIANRITDFFKSF